MGGRRAARAGNADRCAICREPVLFSAATSICFSPSPPPLSLLERTAASLPPPRRAQQAVRSGRCADRLSVCLPARLAVLFWLFAGQGADRGGERGRGGRLLEITEITAAMEDKMLMEEVLGKTCWTSADAERACMLRGRPAICGSAFTGAYQHHHVDHLAHLVVPLEQVDFGGFLAPLRPVLRGIWLLG